MFLKRDRDGGLEGGRARWEWEMGNRNAAAVLCGFGIDRETTGVRILS